MMSFSLLFNLFLLLSVLLSVVGAAEAPSTNIPVAAPQSSTTGINCDAGCRPTKVFFLF